jgi:tetraacyldisaccharide 4'-kinase
LLSQVRFLAEFTRLRRVYPEALEGVEKTENTLSHNCDTPQRREALKNLVLDSLIVYLIEAEDSEISAPHLRTAGAPFSQGLSSKAHGLKAGTERDRTLTMVEWPKVHEKTALSPGMIPLAGLSLVYGLAVRTRIRLYERRPKKALPGFVLSIGNLTVGGTGKTPASAMIADWALREGYRPAILSRGYGGKHGGKTFKVSDGQHLLGTPAEAGDEPYLLAMNLPRVPVILSKARYEAGLLSHQQHGSNFFILDDGFQHLRLKRDLDLVLLDATNPFGNMYLLPRGPLREPVEHLRRADVFILTRTGYGSNLIMMNFLKKKFGGKPTFQSEHVPERLLLPCLGLTHGPDYLRGKRVVGFAGIAKPEAFRDTLIRLGAEVAGFKGFRDHHAFLRPELQELISERRRLNADLLITTEKDYVRLGNLASGESTLGYLTVRFRIISEAETFFELIRGRAEKAGLTS